MSPLSIIKKHKKKIVAGVAVVAILVIYLVFIKKPVKPETFTVTKGDFLQQVSVSGKVAATENLDLSFEQAGIVRGVYVKVGDMVPVGKFITTQGTDQLSAQLAQMQAGIDLQKAKLDQLLAGGSPESVKAAEDKVVSAKQDLNNAYQNSVVVLNTSYNAIYNASTVALYMNNTYFSANDQSGVQVQNAKVAIAGALVDAKERVDNAGIGFDQPVTDAALAGMVMDLKITYTALKAIREQCDQGVYYSRVSATDKTSVDTQKININTALTSTTSSQTDVSAYKAAIVVAQTNVAVAQAPPRQTDIAVYQAQIKQAQAQAQDVVAQIRKKQIFAPIAGVIIAVNAKPGTIMGAGEVAVSMISAGNFQIESYVPEIYVSMVAVGDEAEVTLDSYGADKVFKAKVISIDPSQTLKDGVSTYKTKLELEGEKNQFKAGMSANVIITTDKKSDVISVPQGVLISHGGKKFVKVQQGDSVVETQVQVGEVSSSGQAEIISGLNEGDTVVIK